MICQKCGISIVEETLFCPQCGAKVSAVSDYGQPQPTTNKTWDVFARLSYIFGIISVCAFFLASIIMMLGVTGIVFGALGKKSPLFSNKAKTGLTLSIVGTILAFIMQVIYTVIFAEDFYRLYY